MSSPQAEDELEEFVTTKRLLRKEQLKEQFLSQRVKLCRFAALCAFPKAAVQGLYLCVNVKVSEL